jgi:NMD protein affecting ribosome stability and mRNA decay
MDALQITCPRCGRQVAARFYGPCGGCHDELRARFAGQAREVLVAAYEPKMNVTPNAVALKD